MSRIDFASFRSNIPDDLSSVWEKLAGWATEHQTAEFLDPRRLAIDLSPVPTFELMRAINLLVERGAVRREFRVLDTDGVIVPGEFTNLNEIPQEMPDRLHHYFHVEKKNILPVYRMTASE